ncbi:MAG: 2Fe-2S iron-sulfur cluster-binding protein [Candidatus Margulisiibacteriota bacterium]
MALLYINDQEVEVADGDKIVDAIEEAGVPIGCSNGVCGTCEVEVTEGMEHLSELTDEEKDLGMEGAKRLGCQCTISGGTVKLTY